MSIKAVELTLLDGNTIVIFLDYIISLVNNPSLRQTEVKVVSGQYYISYYVKESVDEIMSKIGLREINDK